MTFDNLFIQTREFLVLNGSTEPVTLRYDGEEFVIPASDKVVKPDNSRKFSSGLDSEKQLIPGSLVIKDIYGARGCPDDISGNARGNMWDAGACIAHCLGIDPLTRQASGKLAERGITMLPLSPSPELVEQTRAESAEKYKKFKQSWANETVEAYQAKANQHRALGLHAALPAAEYYEALKTIKDAEKEHEEKIQELGFTQDPLKESGDDLLEIAREAATSLVKERPELDKDAVVEMLMNDPKYRAKIDSYRIKNWNKKGKKQVEV